MHRLPVAAAPAAMAGLAAAFALGNAPAAMAATVDASGSHSAVTADSTVAVSAPQLGVSAELLVAITGQPAAGPVIRLDADQVTALKPKGKHHHTAHAKYIVKPGDTLASIAQHLYHSSNYWTVLYWANHHEIKYANEIEVGQALVVPAKPAKIPAAPAALASSPAPMTSTAETSGTTGASSTPAPAPAQTGSNDSGSSSFQSCVIARESGGNPQAMSAGGYYGLYQFSASTWAEYGGNPAEFGDATVAEQNQVFDNAIAAGGASNWSLYDGC
jgi:LysM repeat protein